MEQANVSPGTNAYWAYAYNPSNNTFDAVGNMALGTVGSNFRVVGFGTLGTSGQDEMLMQDAAGDFEVYQYNARTPSGQAGRRREAIWMACKLYHPSGPTADPRN